MAKIYWRGRPPVAPGEYELGDATTIGRAKENEVALLDVRLSRRHARIVREGDAYYLEDLESRNGTQLNGEAVTRAALARGDTIEIGDTAIKFDEPFPDDETAAEAAASAPPFLVHMEDGAGGEAIPLAGERAAVGRSSDNEIVLADARVSSHHAVIFREGKTWWIEDLKSTNGTTIGEERIARAPLAHGAVVGFGGVRLRFLLPGLPEPPPPPREPAPAAQAADGAEHRAVLTAVTLAALAAVFFGGWGAAQHFFVGGAVETAAPGNLVGSHFSFEEGAKAPLGWRALPGAVLDRVPGGLPPGRFAGRVRADEDRPGAAAIVECAETCTVVPSSAYTLQGVCTHEGEGACGLAVAWLEGEDVIEVSYGDLCESGARLAAADTFTCPPRCERARVLLLGFGGTATFDRIEFAGNDAPEEAGLSAAAGEFALRIDRTGAFDVHLGKERVLGAVRLHFGAGVRGFKELPGQRLGFGSVRAEGEGAPAAAVARSVFVPETGAWVTVQTRSTLTEEGGTVAWRFPRSAGLEKARVAIAFKLPEDPLDGGKRFTVYGPGGRRAAASSELSGMSAGEIAIGNVTFQGSAARRHRVVVAFPGAGTLLAQGGELVFHVEKELELKLAQEMYELAVSWSFESAYEEREVDESIAEARKLARQGREGRAIARLQEAAALAGSTPGAAARIAAVQKELRREGARLLAQAEALSAQLAAREDPVVARALRDVLDEIARRYEGFAEVTAAAKAMASKQSLQARGATAQREETRRDDALARAKALIARRSFAAAAVTLGALLEGAGGGAGLPAEMRRAVTDQLDECLRHLKSRAELPPVPPAPAKEAVE
ncbi:MAG TPA: hypothetical protein DCM87_03150 [Planctomycetes bacterium]|nr:hypothetical protein [Planctomycetota bacterium]